MTNVDLAALVAALKQTTDIASIASTTKAKTRADIANTLQTWPRQEQILQ
ncbi:hypothetical protein L195_g062143, partial [Trifolium pratense]